MIESARATDDRRPTTDDRRPAAISWLRLILVGGRSSVVAWAEVL
jgi:hypothetical protein